MKKTVSAVLAAILLLFSLLPAAAQPEADVISLRLHSDVAGCTAADAARLIEILSPQVAYRTDGSTVRISNAAGGGEYAHMDSGRSYYIVYTLSAAPGYQLPETLSENDISIECGKGVSLISFGVVELAVPSGGKDARERVLRIYANVVPDGSVFQRIVGFIKDVILKIRSWQLY